MSVSFISFPFIYSFYTRIKHLKTVLSFFVTFLLPVFLLSLYASNYELSNLEFLASFLILFLVYEIGYLFNDCHTTLYEDNPTYRMPRNEFDSLCQRYPLHIALRLVIIFGLFFFIGEHISCVKFILSLILLNLIYCLHNYYRDERNIFTIFFLMIFKYLSIPMAAIDVNGNVFVLLSFITLVPLIRALLFTVHPRINIDWFENIDINVFRFKYYSFLSILFFFVSIFRNEFFVILLISFLFGIFYLSSVVLSHFHEK
ncbi:hypothetical protein BCT17_06700 [Vibrio sp. 10N.222.54.F10]|nr:hypothetical protein BCT17_06700 [Vibrio sp. 10N.222.54.F10]